MAWLWCHCPKGVQQQLQWRSRADVRAGVQAVRTLQFVEWFCGTGNLTTACSQLGLRVKWYDITLDSVKMNLLTNAGFAAAIRLALSIVMGGTAWFGVPCSTFVFMSRGHTKRSWRFPKGNTKRKDVRQANEIVDRVAFLIDILACRKVHWIMEQPLNSLLCAMPAMRRAQKKCRVSSLKWQRRFIWMGHYGHSLWKPTELVGCFPGMATAWPTKRPSKRETSSAYRQWVDSNGRRRSAGRAGLKATEHYPVAFCDVTARLIKAALQALQECADITSA